MQAKDIIYAPARILRGQLVLGLKSFLDPVFYVILALGFAAWLVPKPYFVMSWEWLLAKALVEEIFFRFLLQETLARELPRARGIGPLSAANLLASAAFAGMHLFRQPTHWALLTFFPSLMFGYLWDRHKSVLPCWLAHFTYNFLLFYRFGLVGEPPILTL